MPRRVEDAVSRGCSGTEVEVMGFEVDVLRRTEVVVGLDVWEPDAAVGGVEHPHREPGG